MNVLQAIDVGGLHGPYLHNVGKGQFMHTQKVADKLKKKGVLLGICPKFTTTEQVASSLTVVIFYYNTSIFAGSLRSESSRGNRSERPRSVSSSRSITGDQDASQCARR